MAVHSRFPHDDAAPEKKCGWARATELFLNVLLLLASALTLFVAVQLWRGPFGRCTP
jgi:hypothetical protein